jgi:hypothetical protein
MAVGTVKVESGESPKYATFGTGTPVGAPPPNFTTTVQASNAWAKTSPWTTFQVIASAVSGTVSCTVQIQVTNEDATAAGTNSNWLNFGTAITITAAASPATAGFPLVAADPVQITPWRYVRANVTALSASGSGPSCQVLMGS